MDFLISTAHAQQAGGGAQGSAIFNLLFIGGMFVLFYLMLWRPQSKQLNMQKSAVAAALPKGTIKSI